MSWQKLSGSTAFNPGDGLWVLPQPEKSAWSRKLNWYLNFQLTQAESHQAPTLSPGFVDLLQENGLALPTLQTESMAPLMVSTRTHLPLTQLVQVPFSGDLATWFRAAANVALNLKQDQVRVFLPSGIEQKDLQLLANFKLPQQTSVVFDANDERT